MPDFTPDYLLLAFTSSLGVLLIVTGYSRIHGLLLFSRGASIVIGWLLVVGAFASFFGSEPRNVPDTGAGLDGNEQVLLFFLGALAALALVLVASSVRNWYMAGDTREQGLDALRESNYLRLILKEARIRWNTWNVRTKRRSSG